MVPWHHASAMNIPLTKRWIEHWEGRRLVAYDDATGLAISPGVPVKGTPTIGVGLNLFTATAKQAIAALGLNYADVISGHRPLTNAQVDSLLDSSFCVAHSAARTLIPAFDAVPENQQIVFVDLVFNLGLPRLSKFTGLLQAARSSNWAAAAAALQDSLWFHQVGPARHQRGGADVAMLAGLCQPEEILGV